MLEDYWYIALEDHRLTNKPVQVFIFGKPIVLFRSKGKVIALEDRCAHRNVFLSQGKLCGQNLQCPYHGWEYDEQGRVARIPSLNEKMDDVIQIGKYKCLEQDGYIWVCLGSSSEPTPKRLPFVDQKGWHTIRERAHFKAPVLQVLENFLDIPHAIYVHSFWFRKPLGKKTTAIIRTLPDGVEAELNDEPRDKGVVWKLLGDSRVSMKHSDRFIAPSTSHINYTYSDGRRFIVTSVCTPINECETMVHTVITFRSGLLSPLLKIALLPIVKLLIWQDVRITALQQKSIEAFDRPPKFRVVKSDLLYSHIFQWRKSMELGLPTPVAGKETQSEIYL